MFLWIWSATLKGMQAHGSGKLKAAYAKWEDFDTDGAILDNVSCLMS